MPHIWPMVELRGRKEKTTGQQGQQFELAHVTVSASSVCSQNNKDMCPCKNSGVIPQCYSRWPPAENNRVIWNGAGSNVVYPHTGVLRRNEKEQITFLH